MVHTEEDAVTTVERKMAEDRDIVVGSRELFQGSPLSRRTYQRRDYRDPQHHLLSCPVQQAHPNNEDRGLVELLDVAPSHSASRRCTTMSRDTPDGSFDRAARPRQQHGTRRLLNAAPATVPVHTQSAGATSLEVFKAPSCDTHGSDSIVDILARAKIVSSLHVAESPCAHPTRRRHCRPAAFGAAAAAIMHQGFHAAARAPQAASHTPLSASVLSDPHRTSESPCARSITQWIRQELCDIAPLIVVACEQLVLESQRVGRLDTAGCEAGDAEERGNLQQSSFPGWPSASSFDATDARGGCRAGGGADALRLQTFLREISATVKFGGSCQVIIMASLIYLSRVVRSTTRRRGKDTSNSSTSFLVTHCNWYPLMVVCMLVATKMYTEQEHHRINDKFAATAQMELSALRRHEIDFLYLVDFTLLVEESEMARWCDWLLGVAQRRNLRTPLRNFLLEKGLHLEDSATPVSLGNSLQSREWSPTRSVEATPQQGTLSGILAEGSMTSLHDVLSTTSNADATEIRLFSCMYESSLSDSDDLLPPPEPPTHDDSPLKRFAGDASTHRDPDDDLVDALLRMGRRAAERAAPTPRSFSDDDCEDVRSKSPRHALRFLPSRGGGSSDDEFWSRTQRPARLSPL